MNLQDTVDDIRRGIHAVWHLCGSSVRDFVAGGNHGPDVFRPNVGIADGVGHPSSADRCLAKLCDRAGWAVRLSDVGAGRLLQRLRRRWLLLLQATGLSAPRRANARLPAAMQLVLSWLWRRRLRRLRARLHLGRTHVGALQCMLRWRGRCLWDWGIRTGGYGWRLRGQSVWLRFRAVYRWTLHGM